MEGNRIVHRKKSSCKPSYFAFTGAVMDLGYENPLEVVDWEIYQTIMMHFAALSAGMLPMH